MSKCFLIGSCALRIAAVLIILTVFSGIAGANDPFNPNAGPVPEVDPTMMASALTVLAGGGLLLADRMRRMARVM